MEGEVNQVEQEARTLGWVPAEEFKGDPARWVDADTFVERGHTVMPILRKNNERLEGLVRSQAQELERMKNMVSASQGSIQALQEVHANATKAAVEKARREVMVELKQAKMDGDVDREIALTDELQELKVKGEELTKKPTQQQTQVQVPNGLNQDAVHPDLQAWMAENRWFGTDERKTRKAMGIAQILRADPENDGLQGREFFERVATELDGEAPRASKVGGSRPSGSSASGSGNNSFNSLPAEAREACDRQAKKVVGEGRAFKDMNAWRTYYTKLYNEGA